MEKRRLEKKLKHLNKTNVEYNIHLNTSNGDFCKQHKML